MRKRGSTIAITCVIGLIGLTNVTRNPRFESFHAVDVLQLIASGMCFGVALAYLLRRRDAKE